MQGIPIPILVRLSQNEIMADFRGYPVSEILNEIASKMFLMTDCIRR